MYYVIASGKKKSKLGETAIEEVCKELEAHNQEFIVWVAEYAGHTTELAKLASEKEDCTAIIAVGGDGTFYEVLNGMDTKKVPIGFVPAGTGNDFARALGITPNVKDCINNIVGHEPIYLDYLKVNDHRAFNVCGTGFDILLLEKEIEIRKTGKTNDKGSYTKALIHTILHWKSSKITYSIDDGETKEADTFMIDCCNGIWGGGKMPLALDADPHDGLMDFSIIHRFPRIKTLPLLLTFLNGKIQGNPYYEYCRCKKVKIDMAEPKLKANLDGELLDLFPITVEVVHEELRYFPSLTPPRPSREILKDKKAV